MRNQNFKKGRCISFQYDFAVSIKELQSPKYAQNVGNV
jgi:hypothetical protein